MISLLGIGGGGRIWERGEFSDSFVIAGGGSATKNYTLGRDDFEIGFLQLHAVPPTGSSRRRIVFNGYFTTDIDEAHGDGTDVVTYSLYGYLFDAWHPKGYDYNTDSQLSPSEYYGTGGAARSHVKSVRINGANLEIVWENSHGSISSRVAYNGVYHVFK